jgi:hypothetical protein
MQKEDLQSLCNSVFVPGGSILLLEANVESVSKSSSLILSALLRGQGSEGTVIAVNKPYSKINEELKAEGVDVSGLFFVDMISSTKDSTLDDGKIVLLRSPESLTECSIAVAEFVDRMVPGRSFVFMDSISTLLIYNNETSVAKFIHHLTIKMRMRGIGGIFCLIQGQVDLHLRAEIGQLFDKVIGFDNALL